MSTPHKRYGRDDLANAFKSLGVGNYPIIYIISALWHFPGCSDCDDADLPRMFYETIRDCAGSNVTIAAPTTTQNLCNTDIAFDPDATPAHERGILSEYIRTLPGAKRSFHPFNSYAAIGPLADEITAKVARSAYGPETPEARMIEKGALVINLGLPPNICTTVHHVEHVMAVPYRYTKEFMHPVVRPHGIETEPFYLYVWYRGIDLQRSMNKPLFGKLKSRIDLRETRIGSGRIFSYPIADFYREAVKIYAEDIYTWCSAPPTIRPYRT